jgi:hypothetical protein
MLATVIIQIVAGRQRSQRPDAERFGSQRRQRIDAGVVEARGQMFDD